MALELTQLLSQVNLSAANIGRDADGVVAQAVDVAPRHDLLLHELQLGGKLNESVVDIRRADFSLMLAMLAEDVREHSQFALPKVSAEKSKESSNRELRKAFNLPQKAKLALTHSEEINKFNQGEIIANNDMATIHLSNAMKHTPIAFRDNKSFISAEVMSNTSVICQQKYQQSLLQSATETINVEDKFNTLEQGIDEIVNQELSFDAKYWLDGIENSLVNAPLIS